jgi:hypothetical protein
MKFKITVYNNIKKLKQPYAYVTGISNNGIIFINEINETGGDFYEEKDLDSYLKITRKQKLEKLNKKAEEMNIIYSDLNELKNVLKKSIEESKQRMKIQNN